jgi:hypothetical protein
VAEDVLQIRMHAKMHVRLRGSFLLFVWNISVLGVEVAEAV